MQSIVPLACFFSLIRPPGVRFESGLLQIVPVNKAKCPFVKDTTDIGFQLFTRHNPTVFQPLTINDDEKLFASNIDFHAPTVIYFGAFLEQPDDGSGLMVREAYMLRGDANVIMVDSRTLEAGPWYFTAAENTWYIGNFAAQFIDYLVSRGLNLTTTHLVGHSLGAQSAGVAGSAIKSGRISRITGLDPAFPLFDKLPLEQRLDSSDAEFVDVIHTDAGIFGFNRPIGHVDFYPNGGISPQPGCELEVVLHQQHLTNKCEGRTEQPVGFYTFYLQPNGQKDFKTKLYEFFTYIQTLKNNTDNLPPEEKAADKQNNIKSSNSDKQYVNEYDKDIKISNNITDVKSIMQSKLSLTQDLLAVDSSVDIRVQTFNTNDKHSSIEYSENGNKQNMSNFKNVYNTESVIDHKIDSTELRALEINQTDKSTNVDVTTEHLKYNADETLHGKDKHKDTANKQLSNDTNKVRTKLNPIDILQKTVQRQRQAPFLDIENFKQFTTKTDVQRNKKTTRHRDNKTPTDQKQRKKRQKRFLPFLQKSEAAENDNLLMKMLDFLFKHRKNVLPVITVMREINTLVKSGNGELNHVTKERNNYIGTSPVLPSIGTYTLELGNENKVVAFMKKLIGLGPKGDRLTIAGGK